MAKRNSVGSMQRNLQSSKNFQPQYGTAQDEDGENGICAALITFASYILVFLTLPISIWGCVKVTILLLSFLSEDEREREKERKCENVLSNGATIVLRLSRSMREPSYSDWDDSAPEGRKVQDCSSSSLASTLTGG